MSLQHGRYRGAKALTLAEGWSATPLTPPSRLFGSNGLRTGPDGRVYVCELAGSQVSAIDLATGQIETISPRGGDIVAPDDVAFDPEGNLYATEVMNARVSVRDKSGRTRVLQGDLPNANGITFHGSRLFVGECRIGGRLLELSLNGGAPRVLAENLPMPNAMEVGPDGMLYYPLVGMNEIWRIHPDGGTPERVAADLGVPDALKFDAKGFIVSTQVRTGEVLRIDPRTGDRTVLARLDPGLDNLTFAGERLFVSNFTGQITEILNGGETRSLLPAGLAGPLGLCVSQDGSVFVADGPNFFQLLPTGKLRTLGMLFSDGFPGYCRGVTSLRDGEFIVATAVGTVARWAPDRNESEVLAHGLEQAYGVAVAADGAVVFADLGSGRVLSAQAGQVSELASGLREPLGVAVGPSGACYVSEAAGGRVVQVSGSRVDTVVDGFQRPEGIAVHGDQLYVLDARAQTLTAFDVKTKARNVIARELPVGAPPGVIPKHLGGIPPFTGPQNAFAGLAAAPDGTLYVSADADGSVIALKQSAQRLH